jgi:hypothetical protein
VREFVRGLLDVMLHEMIEVLPVAIGVPQERSFRALARAQVR